MCTERELDAVASQDLAERFAQRPRFAGEHVCAALDEKHLAAKSAHGLRHLYADRPASEHEQTTRDSLHAGHFAVGPDSFEAAQARYGWDDRFRPCRDHYVLGRIANAVDIDHARSGQSPTTAKEINAMIGEPALLSDVQ